LLKSGGDAGGLSDVSNFLRKQRQKNRGQKNIYGFSFIVGDASIRLWQKQQRKKSD